MWAITTFVCGEAAGLDHTRIGHFTFTTYNYCHARESSMHCPIVWFCAHHSTFSVPTVDTISDNTFGHIFVENTS
ncbi:hypothetical protein J6590_059031 [Homalodisca vitripennis]|nr:hypothetical protein J6590_059031 [Homalodisca vitripennis]